MTSTDVWSGGDQVFQVDVDSTCVSKVGEVGSELFALCVESSDR